MTAKQEAFAQAVADGMTLADAYRKAYPKQAMKDDVVWVRASELMKHGKVAVRVAELREALAEKQLWTREESVQTLRGVIANPDSAKDVVAAVKELNAMHGFNAAVKVEHDGALQVIIKAYADHPAE